MRSYLHELHRSLGARFVDFGGWEMPVQYESVLAEHRAVRESAGWFDVSHLGRFAFQGPSAGATLRHLLCNDVAKIGDGRAQYTLMLNEMGGVIDDLIIWKWQANSFWILPNAANHQRVMDRFSQHDEESALTDLQLATVTIAVQGPEAPSILSAVLGEAPGRFRTMQTSFGGGDLWAAGTGYTGERGGELVVAPDVAVDLANALTEAGAVPCGLGARDTLRLEAGLPLWGQDLSESITPLEAGLDFAVALGREFVGSQALEAQKRDGLPKALVAFKFAGRQIARTGARLRSGDSAGEVTSGNFSPVLERGIGMGYLSPPVGPKAAIEAEIRGKWVEAERVQLPFVPRG